MVSNTIPFSSVSQAGRRIRLRNPVIAARAVCDSQPVAAVSSSSVAPSSRWSSAMRESPKCAKYIGDASGIPIADIKKTPNCGRGNESYFVWPTEGRYDTTDALAIA